MTFEVKENDKYLELTINADKITTDISPSFKSKLLVLSKLHKSGICDLKSVDYVDSSGLSSLLIGDRLFGENECKFILCNCSTKVLNLIKITKLESILTIVPTLSEAKDFILFDEIEKSFEE